jgi:AcrR family transcriptional regulator
VAHLPQSLSKAPVGRTRLSRARLGEHQRERILIAATEVFAKRGFQAATVENIVSAAKIGVGSFYAQFDGKDDCLMAAYETIAAEARGRIGAAMPADADWPLRACVGLRALLQFVVDDPLAARVALLEVQTGGPRAMERYGETLEEIAAFLRQGREISVRDLELAQSFEEATASGLVWLLQERLVRGEIDDAQLLFAEMAEVALEPYLGAAQTKRRIKAFAASPA